MFPSISREDDLDEMEFLMNKKNSKTNEKLMRNSILVTCLSHVLEYIDREKGIPIVMNILLMSKFIRKYFTQRNHFSLGVFLFHAYQPKFLASCQAKKYVYQMVVSNEDTRTREPFKDSYFSYFPNLQKLVLRTPGSAVRDTGFKHIPQLQYLEIDNRNSHGKSVITSEIFKKKLTPNLKKLFLIYLPLGFDFKPITNLDNLVVLHVQGGFVNSKKLFKALKALGSKEGCRLRTIILVGCNNLRNEHFKNTPSSVKKVCIRQCKDIEGEAVSRILKGVNVNIKFVFDNFRN